MESLLSAFRSFDEDFGFPGFLCSLRIGPQKLSPFHRINLWPLNQEVGILKKLLTLLVLLFVILPGFCFYEVHRWGPQRRRQDRIDDYTEEIEANPGAVRSLIPRAELLYRRGEIDRAIRDLEQALKFEPCCQTAVFLYLDYTNERGDDDAAALDVCERYLLHLKKRPEDYDKWDKDIISYIPTPESGSEGLEKNR